MKKTIVVTLAIILVSVSLLCGCNEEKASNDDLKNIDERILGGWMNYSDDDSAYAVFFDSNGSCTGIMYGDRYETEDGRLIFTFSSTILDYEPFICGYFFTDNDTKLIITAPSLTQEGEFITTVFTKTTIL